jgi:alcohol dehydrogenase class IV
VTPAGDFVPTQFEFATAARILFGAGSINEIGTIAAPYGSRAILMCGIPDSAADPIQKLLQAAGLETILHRVEGEPHWEGILQATNRVTETGGQMVIGLGGGSALDTAKAAAVLAANPGNPMDYLEVVGKGLPLLEPGLPCIAIPTTAGTGAEVTRNAVIGIPERKVKVSLRSAWLLPKAAIVDPALTITLPSVSTAYTGLDALTQVLEPFVCAHPNPLTDGFCRDGLPRAARSLLAAYADGQNLSARYDMSLVSLYGGLSLANAGLGAVHGFAAPLGGLLAAPHGAICARLLPYVIAANIRALRSRAAGSPTLERFGEISSLLTGNTGAAPESSLDWVLRLVDDLNIPRLRHWGLAESDFESVAEKASRASSMKANCIVLTAEELYGILKAAI